MTHVINKYAIFCIEHKIQGRNYLNVYVRCERSRTGEAIQNYVELFISEV